MRRTLHRLLSRRLSRQTDTSFTQLVALKAIALEDVRSQAALAERLLVDAPAVSRLVDRMEEEGWVRRCAGADRRCVRLEVTEAGLAQVEVLRREMKWMEGEVSRHLTARELTELKRLLQKLQAGLTAGQDPERQDDCGQE